MAGNILTIMILKIKMYQLVFHKQALTWKYRPTRKNHSEHY